MIQRLTIGFLFVLTASVTLSQNVISDGLRTFLSYQDFNHATIGFAAYDLDQKKLITSENLNTSLPTASTAKLFSTASALELLGPSFQPVTRLYYDGNIDSNGVLKGNIWIRGGGDPSLGSKYFNNPESKKCLP